MRAACTWPAEFYLLNLPTFVYILSLVLRTYVTPKGPKSGIFEPSVAKFSYVIDKALEFSTNLSSTSDTIFDYFSTFFCLSPEKET